jgi:hypothetical protein
MGSVGVRKRRTLQQLRASIEALEGRNLLSTVQPLPVWETTYSSNWSGYAAETNLNAPASNAVTQVSGSWTVPNVTGTTNAYSSVWVGIDGYSSSSVEQLGTEQDTSKTGATSYYAWWEMYPNPTVQITTVPISPGDSISASVTYSSNTFTLWLKDNRTGASFSTGQSGTPQRSSAEWIVEAPSSFFGVLPLANFGTATFTKAQATIGGITGAIDNSAWQDTSIDMVGSSGTVIDQTSGLTDTTTAPITSSFSVAYTGSSSGTGGHSHGHGHGPIQPVGFVGPVSTTSEALAAIDAKPNSTSQLPDTSTPQNQIAVAPPADTFVPQVQERPFAPGLKSWRGS